MYLLIPKNKLQLSSMSAELEHLPHEQVDCHKLPKIGEWLLRATYLRTITPSHDTTEEAAYRIPSKILDECQEPFCCENASRIPAKRIFRKDAHTKIQNVESRSRHKQGVGKVLRLHISRLLLGSCWWKIFVLLWWSTQFAFLFGYLSSDKNVNASATILEG